MRVDEALARLAGKSGFKIEQISGGTAGITVHDIAAACSGLRRDSYILALALWVEDYSHLEELIAGVEGYTKRVARQDKWRIPKDKPIIPRMAAMAIDEVVFAHKHRCKACTNGFIYRKGGHIDPCRHCNGNPSGRMSTRDRAAMLDVNQSNMSRNWSDKYEVIHRHVLNMRNKAWSHIGKGLISHHN